VNLRIIGVFFRQAQIKNFDRCILFSRQSQTTTHLAQTFWGLPCARFPIRLSYYFFYLVYEKMSSKRINKSALVLQNHVAERPLGFRPTSLPD